MSAPAGHRAPVTLGALPRGRAMVTVDKLDVAVAPAAMFAVVREVTRWPEWLAHYRFVRFRERDARGGGIVEMAAYRPFGPVGWPTWWLSEMEVVPDRTAIRFRHIGGITTGMDVEWAFLPGPDGGTEVRLLHVWNGPRWPLIGRVAATAVIGPVFVHGIASRTLAGLARVATAAGR